MIDPEYKSTAEAWQSGYNAAVHDFVEYSFSWRPWWIPRNVWYSVMVKITADVYVGRGADL